MRTPILEWRIVPTISLDNENFDIEHLLPTTELSVASMDVEKFIYHLPYRNVAVLVFLSMGYKPKEIMKIMRFKNVNSIHHIVGDLRKRHASADL